MTDLELINKDITLFEDVQRNLNEQLYMINRKLMRLNELKQFLIIEQRQQSVELHQPKLELVGEPQ